MEIVDNHSVARECIQFLMLFFAISKKPRAPLAEIKLHSRAFDVLFTLQVFPGRELTMSALAEETVSYTHLGRGKSLGDNPPRFQ